MSIKQLSPLRWAGSKSKLIPILKNIIDNNILPTQKIQQIVEPFVGSAILSLNIQADEYIWNDINYDLINFYNSIKNEKQEFIDLARSYFINSNMNKNSYLDLRDIFNHTQINTPERGALFLYLNRAGFNGLCRYNKKGQYNVPFGLDDKVRKIAKFPEKEIQYFLSISEKVKLHCGEFHEITSLINHHAIVYCDPPYISIKENERIESQYWHNSFTNKNQEELTLWVKNLHKSKNSFCFISNHDTIETRQLYHNFKIIDVETYRTISAKKDGRKKVPELIAIAI